MMRLLIAALILLPASAVAQQADETVYVMPRIPDEAEKKAALMRAYEMNGNSMSGAGKMIDLTDVYLTPPPAPAEKADKATIKPKDKRK